MKYFTTRHPTTGGFISVRCLKNINTKLLTFCNHEVVYPGMPVIVECKIAQECVQIKQQIIMVVLSN